MKKFYPIFYLLEKKEKRFLMLIVFLLLMGLFFEIVGLSLLLPLINYFNDPSSIENYDFFSEIIFEIKKYTKSENLTIVLLLTYLLIYLIKSFFISILSYQQNKFLSNASGNISIKLFNYYLKQPYNFFLIKNSSKLIKNIQVEVNYFHSYLNSLIILFVEISFTLFIAFTLVILRPYYTIIFLLSIFIPGLVLNSILNRKNEKWGKLREIYDKNISKILFENFSGIKDILISNELKLFVNNFSKNVINRASIIKKHDFSSNLPRQYLELLVVISILNLLIYSIYNQTHNTELLASLAIILAGSLKLIPSLNRISVSYQDANYYSHSVNKIYNELNHEMGSSENNYPVRFNTEIEFKHIFFSYNSNKKVLRNFNLKIKKGEFIGIVGDSGSGKSTLLDIMMGLLSPQKGDILVDGKKINLLNINWKRKIGYVSQKPYFFDQSLMNNIAFGIKKEEIDIEKVIKISTSLGIFEFIDNIDTIIGENANKLSGGQKQRIAIARAIYKEPEILFLDESTSGLEIELEEKLIQQIRFLCPEATIVIVSHRSSSFKQCDRIIKF